jgi:hypothetical protein
VFGTFPLIVSRTVAALSERRIDNCSAVGNRRYS